MIYLYLIFCIIGFGLLMFIIIDKIQKLEKDNKKIKDHLYEHHGENI